MVRIPEKGADFIKAVQAGLVPDRIPSMLMAGRDEARRERYLHWDDTRHRRPPHGLTREDWWLGMKLTRAALYKTVPLTDRQGAAFQFCLPDLALRRLHYIDQNMSGQIAISEEVTNPATRDRYIVNSLIEEAITSSQLEGAATTRRVAKDMIRSGRAPRDRSERMIMNNFDAMRRVSELRLDDLTPELVLELHRIVSRDTLSSKAAEGRLQTPEDERVSIWTPGVDPTILHRPPPAGELPARLEAMCRFANGVDEMGFIHPVVKAVILHFWLAYDHPFEDGNGRTARTLFYWSMLHDNYWLAEYVPISRILRRAPAQYARAFLFTETDDNDLTYFLLYNLTVIERAVKELHSYLQDKIRQIREVEQLLRQAAHLNRRQLALLGHAMRHPDFVYTIESHRRSNDVVYQTARTDLLGLASQGYLRQVRIGRAMGFVASTDLLSRATEGEPAENPRDSIGPATWED